MAGRGSRFAEQGYDKIKPLIEVSPGVPMIEAVVRSIGIEPADYIFIAQHQHMEETNLFEVLHRLRPDALFIEQCTPPTGAATSLLLAEDDIDPDKPLIICNSDNILDWAGKDAYQTMLDLWPYCNGLIPTFTSTDPRYSYVSLNEHGHVDRVAEKRVISNMATAGLYVWETSWDFFTAAHAMIAADDRVNDEFYVAPVFNYNINRSEKVPFIVRPVPVDNWYGVGTPEELLAFQQRALDDQP
jgi:NDP-sugar pyrophosphorylase family protein